MTKRDLALEMLRAGGKRGVRNGEFTAAGCHRFSARLYELRNEGYEIEREIVSPGLHIYRLISEPEAVSAQPVSSVAGSSGEALPPAGATESLFDIPAASQSAITGRPL